MGALCDRLDDRHDLAARAPQRSWNGRDVPGFARLRGPAGRTPVVAPCPACGRPHDIGAAKSIGGSLGAVDAAARLAVGGALDEFRALIEEGEIVRRGRVARVEAEGGVELGPRLAQFAAQHVRIALVVEDGRRQADELDRGGVATVGEIEPPQTIGACRQATQAVASFGAFSTASWKYCCARPKLPS